VIKGVFSAFLARFEVLLELLLGWKFVLWGHVW